MDFYDYQKAINALADLTGALPANPAPETAEPAPAQERREPGSKDDPATLGQLSKIREMLAGMGADHKLRAAWIKRQTGYPFPMTVGDAQGLIEALKQMQARNYRFDAPKDGEKAK